MYMEVFSNFIVAEAPTEGNTIVSMLPIILMFVVLYFLMIRPQIKRQKEHRNLISSLSVGDEITTAGGIMGKICKVQENYVFIEVAYIGNQNIEIIVQKNSIIATLPKGTIKSL